MDGSPTDVGTTSPIRNKPSRFIWSGRRSGIRNALHWPNHANSLALNQIGTAPAEKIPGKFHERGGLHKNSANRIIALKFGKLMEIFRFFPQGFPLLCAKLNTAEIFFLAHRKKSCRPFAENYCRALFDRLFCRMLQ